MKRDLVTFAQQNGTLPADPSTFYETKTPEERKRLAALAALSQENRTMEEWSYDNGSCDIDGWVEHVKCDVVNTPHARQAIIQGHAALR